MQRDNSHSEDPIIVLEEALHELELLSDPSVSLVEIGEDGKLEAKEQTRLEKVVALARHYVIRLFSDKARRKEEARQKAFKEKVLHILDIIKIHSPLLERCRQGTEKQKKLVDYAFDTIQKYNHSLEKESSSWSFSASHLYDYQRKTLLADEEMRDRKIDLPRTLSVVYNSHPEANQEFTDKILQVLVPTQKESQKITRSTFSSTVKNREQFMMETFLMKARRLVEVHLVHFSTLDEIYELIKSTPVEMVESDQSIQVHQLLEVGPGLSILLTGAFRRLDSKFMALPILGSFRLSSQLTHSGFPYPSQSIGWSIGEPWVNANPLRNDQTPLFRLIDGQKKELAERFLFDTLFSARARLYAKKKKEVFDQHRALFLPMHRKLQEHLREGFGLEEIDESAIFESFYAFIFESPSPFDKLASVQQRLIALFIEEPLKAVEEEWLEMKESPLRSSPSDLRPSILSERLSQYRRLACERLDESDVEDNFVLRQGSLIGEAFERLVLQYYSEKMGFPPPMLGDFERKLQAIAFRQLVDFIEESQYFLEEPDSEKIKARLFKGWEKILKLFDPSSEEEISSFGVVDELEVYFNSRFYTPRSSI